MIDVGQPVFDGGVGPNTEHHVTVQVRFARDEIAHHVVAYHLLVHRVGLDVFAVERDAFRRRVHPLQRLDQPA